MLGFSRFFEARRDAFDAVAEGTIIRLVSDQLAGAALAGVAGA